MAKGSSQAANDLRKANDKRRKLGILERMNIEDWIWVNIRDFPSPLELSKFCFSKQKFIEKCFL